MISEKEGELAAVLFRSLILSFFRSLSCSTFNAAVTLEVLGPSRKHEGQTVAPPFFKNRIQSKILSLLVRLSQMRLTCVCTCVCTCVASRRAVSPLLGPDAQEEPGPRNNMQGDVE